MFRTQREVTTSIGKVDFDGWCRPRKNEFVRLLAPVVFHRDAVFHAVPIVVQLGTCFDGIWLAEDGHNLGVGLPGMEFHHGIEGRGAGGHDCRGRCRIGGFWRCLGLFRLRVETAGTKQQGKQEKAFHFFRISSWIENSTMAVDTENLGNRFDVAN